MQGHQKRHVYGQVAEDMSRSGAGVGGNYSLYWGFFREGKMEQSKQFRGG